MATEQEKRNGAEAQMWMNRCGPHRGEVFQHFRGGLYVVLGKAIREGDLEEEVIYKSLQDGGVWTRPRRQWYENIESEEMKPMRFKFTGVTLKLGDM